MSREFKFRLWNKATGEYGYTDDGLKIVFPGISTNEHVVIEQYVGLKDKEGKEIYEGDILKCTSRYADVATRFSYVKSCIGHMDLSSSLYDEEIYDYEVVGNIHENPELLEASHG